MRDISKFIGQVIKFHRKKAGLTQLELAKLAGIGKTALYDMEKNNPHVQLSTLLAVFCVLNIRIELISPLMPTFNPENE